MNIIMYYHERYPDNLSAIQMYIAKSNGDLPQGVYAFLESYCCNPKCDCREVKIEIVKQSAMNLGYFETTDKPFATLQYAWESSLSDENPILKEDAYQSEWANAARQVFIDYVEADPNYNEEVSIRFLMMKLKQDPEKKHTKKEKPLVMSNTHKLGRNAPCFCGSGKKYKKCCLTKESSRSI